jgi:predicted DNA-binding antitoxin AbrB/MazE fold protein
MREGGRAILGRGGEKMKAIAALYKEGVFKPLEKVGLEEDANVVIRVERSIVDEMTGIVKAKKEIVDEVVENES